MRNRNLSWGVLLIAIGGLMLASKLFDFQINEWQYFWPIFVLVPGLMFEAGYFLSGKAPGLLVPGGIITTIGLLFFFETFTNWEFAAYTWPIYILAVAIGLFQFYLFGGRDKGVLIAASVMGVLFLIFASFTFTQGFVPWLSSTYLFPILLIILGVVILTRNFKK